MIAATKKYLGLGKTIVQAFSFLRNLTKGCGGTGYLTSLPAMRAWFR